MDELKKLLENAGVNNRIPMGSDRDRAYADMMQPTLNNMRDIATQMVHWASQEDDEDRALKVMMDELHNLLRNKEGVR